MTMASTKHDALNWRRLRHFDHSISLRLAPRTAPRDRRIGLIAMPGG